MEKKRSIYFGQDFDPPIEMENGDVLPAMARTLPKTSLLSAAYRDIPYMIVPHSKKLDVYLPAAGKAPYPVILWFHGGGWYLGDKQAGIAELAEPFLAKGYAVVSADYRLSWRAVFPAQIHDAKAAVRWVRANAAKYDLNPDKIIAAGASAGGFLAALLGTSAGVKELEDPALGNGSCSSRVDGVVEWYAPVNFLTVDAQHLSLCQDPYHSHENSPDSHLLGGKIQDVPDRCREASPLTYINAQTPPFFIVHGKGDVGVPYLQSAELAEALEKSIGKRKVHLELVDKAGHLDSALMAPEIMDKIFRFLAGF